MTSIEHVETIGYKGHTIVIDYDTDPSNPRTEFDNASTMVCFHPRYILGDKHDFSDPDELGYFLGLNGPGLAPKRSDFFTPITDRTVTIGERDRLIALHPRSEERIVLAWEMALKEDNFEPLDAWRHSAQDRRYKAARSAWEDRVYWQQHYGYEKFDGEWLPLYLYDHSRLAMSTGAFSCPWDSGQVGAIYMTRDDILREYGNGTNRLTKAMREQARAIMKAEVSEYNSYLQGMIYGYTIVEGNDEQESTYDPITDEYTEFDLDAAESVDSCGGFYDKESCIAEAKATIDSITSTTQPA